VGVAFCLSVRIVGDPTVLFYNKHDSCHCNSRVGASWSGRQVMMGATDGMWEGGCCGIVWTKRRVNRGHQVVSIFEPVVR